MVRHMPRASVVIPIHEQPDALARCLAALEASGLDDLELVLVDNASADARTAALLAGWEGRAVIRRNPLDAGRTAARNQGARAASAPVVVFLDPRVAVLPGTIETLAEAASDPDAGLVGALLLGPDGRVRHAGMALWGAGRPVALHRGVPGDHPAVTRVRRLALVSGALCAVSREPLLELGGLDLAFAGDLADLDLCMRLGAAGRETVMRGDAPAVLLGDEIGCRRRRLPRLPRALARRPGRLGRAHARGRRR